MDRNFYAAQIESLEAQVAALKERLDSITKIVEYLYKENQVAVRALHEVKEEAKAALEKAEKNNTEATKLVNELKKSEELRSQIVPSQHVTGELVNLSEAKLVKSVSAIVLSQVSDHIDRAIVPIVKQAVDFSKEAKQLSGMAARQSLTTGEDDILDYQRRLLRDFQKDDGRTSLGSHSAFFNY